MSSIQIHSSSPDIKFTGIKDNSIRPPVVVPEAQPQHLPLFFGFTSRGDEEMRVYNGGSFQVTYGTEALDIQSKYCTHTTPFIQGMFSEGNMVMFQRLRPVDAKTSWIRFSLGITPSEKDGKPHYDLRWMTTVTKPEDVANMGSLSAQDKTKMLESLQFGAGLTVKSLGKIGEEPSVIAAGIGSAGGNQERVYPIFDLEVSSFGSYGNNLGLRLSAPHKESRIPVNTKLFDATLARPFRVEMVQRLDKRSAPTTVSNLYGENSVDFVFKPNTLDPVYGEDLYLGTSLLDKYRNLDSRGGRIPTFGPFNDIKVYDENIKHIVETLFQAELVHDSDVPETVAIDTVINGVPGTKYVPTAGTPQGPRLTRLANLDEEEGVELFWQMDFFTGLNIDGLAYRSFQVADTLSGPTTVSMSSKTEHWAYGGADGDTSLENYHSLVLNKLLEFKNSNTPMLDIARYPFTVFYDTGYPEVIKQAMRFFINARRDVSAAWATHSVDEATWTPLTGVVPMKRSEEAAAVRSLSIQIRSFPESDIWGTGCVRANLIMQCGQIINHPYKGFVPMTYEIAMKRAKFMGQGNGVMRSGFGYDQDGNKQLEYVVHANNTFVPHEVQEKNWTGGATWCQFYDRNTMFFPAVRTIYKDETSVLISDINMLIAVDLQKVCFRTWRRLVGDGKLSQAEMIQKSDRIINEETDGRYDGRVVIQPHTHYTPADEQRGYSWSCDLHMYANNMKTVGIFTTIVHRQSDLEG